MAKGCTAQHLSLSLSLNSLNSHIMSTLTFLLGCLLIWYSQDIQVTEDKTRYRTWQYWIRFIVTMLGIMLISKAAHS